MLVKICGTVLVITASCGIGFSKTAELKERVKYLGNMRNAITILENEICFSQTVILSAFEKISSTAQEPIKQLFEEAKNLIAESNGDAIATVWKTAVDKLSNSFHKDDIFVLTEFSECLGEYDVEGQVKSLKHYALKLTQAEDGAKEIYEKNKRLYKSLGLYIGILISAILI